MMATGISHSKIHVLPDEVVGRIAAGEVIERPAAVVKELIDNSLDASSTCITVDVTDGGLTRICVADNGEGMTRDDAVLAFRRHATSKLRSDADLWAIQTLGFRGEALPSIAAVAFVQVATAIPGADVGTRVSIQDGMVQTVEDAAVTSGTRIEIHSLFHNTPARKKYLKSSTTEFSHILQVVQQAGLASPSVQFRLLHNGQEAFQCASAESLRDRLLQIYRRGLVGQMVPVRREGPGVLVEGVAIAAEHLKASRTPQEIFVNRRPVKNPMVLHAVTDAYGPQLAKGRNPRFVLFLEIDPARVDVNVHPTKREVRFADGERLHQLVRQAVKQALGTAVTVGDASVTTDRPLARIVEETLRATPQWVSAGSYVAESPATFGPTPLPQHESLFSHPPSTVTRAEPGPAVQTNRGEVIPLGQVERTFLVACVGDELQVVDQHTAHERVLYERLWRSRQGMKVEAQTLLVPAPLELPAHQHVLLERYLQELEQVGLGLERFGADAFLLRTVPAVLGPADGAALVQALVEDIDEWRTHSSLDARMHHVVATLACHSAVRAGRPMRLQEIEGLVQAWVGEGMMMTCPHGRRVALRFPKDELARIFGRA